MATIGFDPGGSPRREAGLPLDRVAADMRTIFGGRPARNLPAPSPVRVRSVTGNTPVARRSSWRRPVAVLLAGSASGVLLGWWVLATPQGMAPRTATAPERDWRARSRRRPPGARPRAR